MALTNPTPGLPQEDQNKQAYIFFMNLRHALMQFPTPQGMPVMTPDIERVKSRVGEAQWRSDYTTCRAIVGMFLKGSPPQDEPVDEDVIETCSSYGIFSYESEIQILHHLKLLSMCLPIAWQVRYDGLPAILSAIAQASRSVTWRLPFGGLPRNNVLSQRIRDIRGDDSIFTHCLKIIKEHEKEDSEPILDSLIRIIANCVADEDQNRRLALRKDAIPILMAKLKEKRCVELVIPTLQNICINFEDPALTTTPDTAAHVVAPVKQPHIALAHSYPTEGSIYILFDTFDEVYRLIRIHTLSDLIESVTTTVPNDLLFLGISPTAEDDERNAALVRILHRFLDNTKGARLPWHTDTDIFLPIVAAFLNVITIEGAKSVIVSEMLMERVLEMYRELVGTHSSRLQHLLEDRKKWADIIHDDSDLHETLETMLSHLKRLRQEFYAMADTPVFTQVYTFDSRLVMGFVEMICHASHEDEKTRLVYYPLACNIVANQASKEDIANKLVDEYEIHKGLMFILKHVDNNETVLQALGLARRLTLAATSQKLVDSGMPTILQSFYTPSFDMLPPARSMAQCEAIGITHMLFRSRPHLPKVLSTQLTKTICRSFYDLIKLFRACDEPTIKIQISRLFIEYFRTGFMTEDPPRFSGDEIIENYKALATINKNFEALSLAQPIAFLARDGPNPALKGEGWFGLGLMTAVEQHRIDVREVLSTPEMLEEVERVSVEKEGPASNNLKLILSRIVPKELEENVKASLVIEAARFTLGLSPTVIRTRKVSEV